MLNLEGFKNINDTLGHSIGDRLLKEVANFLVATADGSRVYRSGGDEFVVVLADSGDPIKACDVVDRLLKGLSKQFEIDGHNLFVAASAGIAIAPNDGSNGEELLGNADLALYDARVAGGRSYRLFVPTLRAKASARRELDTEIRRAYANNEFVLYFQPQVSADGTAIEGAEALIRWHHPVRGILAPSAFIDALTESAVVLDVGRWILKAACQSAVSWRRNGLPTFRIGINLFPAQFRYGTLLDDVEQALFESGLPAEALELEVTENIALGSDNEMLVVLTALRAKGINIAFDDFGTGFASLSYLTKYPLTRIKIDRSFVQRITKPSNAEDTAIVRSIIAMAKNLKLKVTAEGVETAAQMTFLRSEGCDELQGFFFSKPLPANEFEKLFETHMVARARAS
jgi:diguanylate cyclase (GGDEF)-like protein